MRYNPLNFIVALILIIFFGFGAIKMCKAFENHAIEQARNLEKALDSLSP